MPNNIIQTILKSTSNIKAYEVRITLSAFLLAFVLMASYYLLRPVRDAMASDWSDAEVSTLWSLTFLFSFIAVSIYGKAISQIKLRYLVPSVYAFFAVSFACFYIATHVFDNQTLLDKSFYVWLSVFSLFHISVFWSLMADTFNKEQATRLFAFIATGASVGAIAGPAIPALLIKSMGTEKLLLIAALLLFATFPLVLFLQHLKNSDLHIHNSIENIDFSIGGNPLAGFTEFLKSPYLLTIGAFILLYTSVSSFVYFELKNLMVDFDRETRTQIWAGMDLAVNILTIFTAMFATGRIARRFGLSSTLALIPIIIVVGLLILTAAPLLAVVVVIQIVRRAGNYAVTRPAREMLFTAIDQESRFKAKPVIDIVIYRGGDMLNAWVFTALTQGFGFGLSVLAGIGAVIAAIWAITGIYLGKRFKKSTF